MVFQLQNIVMFCIIQYIARHGALISLSLYLAAIKKALHVISYLCVCIICVLVFVGKLNATLTVENVDSSSVEIHYLISPLLLEASDLTFKIRYNTTTSVTQSSRNFTIFGTNGVVNLVNLSPNTEYLFWMTAEASDGITLAGEVMSFKTLLAGKSLRPVKPTIILNPLHSILTVYFK